MHASATAGAVRVIVRIPGDERGRERSGTILRSPIGDAPALGVLPGCGLQWWVLDPAAEVCPVMLGDTVPSSLHPLGVSHNSF